MHVRAVFFDLAGTLVEVRGGVGVHYASIARRFGVEADAAAIDSVFGVALRSAGPIRFPAATPLVGRDETAAAQPPGVERVDERVAALEKDFWRRVVRGVFDRTGTLGQFSPAQFDSCFNTLFDYFATAEPWSVYPDVVPAIEQMKASGVVVGLLTNFDHRVFSLIERLALLPLVDSITIPSVAGAAKPDRRIFERAIARHGLRPDEGVQVGDSLEDDVRGAEAAGLKGVLIDRRRAASEPATRPGSPTAIGTLLELPAILSGQR